MSFLFLTMPAQAVEYVMTKNNGAKIFICEVRGAGYKVSVTARGNGVYTVLPRGKGTTKVVGNVFAESYEGAARIACGEQ